ncbi:O-methyltransferase-domain-containing protein [Lentinula lateritia]|uniref:O-methyltransferase-domain-containing protein n=1 Tax=Lentinula aff. lateritia TaxID=2804960 RepID=A0ACC1TLV6_9AGAR|nr:O-methyltransferase-domain-containing protein [Lentinula aff. lateritia]KAJ3846504.1 O-methyltransferase-domain-containing protein [Lentinula lateritia]
METYAEPLSKATTLATLSELLHSIEKSSSVLRESLQNQVAAGTNDSTYSESTATALNLRFHADPHVALHASKLRLACDRLAHLATPPRHLVFEAAGSFYLTTALDIIVKSDIATIIENFSNKAGSAGVPVDFLAQESKLDADLLTRLMRHLAVAGIFEEVTLNTFANTTPSSTLINNPEFRAHLDLVMHEGRAAIPFFPELVSKRFSEPVPPPSAFSLYSDGQPFYDWLHSPAQADRLSNFNIAMRGMAHTEGLAFLSDDYPFHRLPTDRLIVDIGGGIGTLPTNLLPALPNHRFVVQDLAPVVSQAREGASSVMKRWMDQGKVRFSFQDCFTPQPPEFRGAVFILKNMIHNYPDPKALEILRNLRNTNPHRLLVIDRLVIPQLKVTDSKARVLLASVACSQRAATFYDLVMASLHGGKNRTLEDWRKLLAQGGFHLEKIYPLRASTGQAVIEATCN